MTSAGREIVEVRAEILADPYNPQLLVHVTAADGTTGTGETWWGTYQPAAEPGTPVRPIAVTVESLLAPRCIGAVVDDPAGIESLWNGMHRATAQYGHEGIVATAMSGVDLALWDLVATRREVPVATLLGPVVHRAIPVYASLTWLGDADAVVRDAERAFAAGIRAVKLHEADPDLVVEVRRRLGPDATIMLDASARFDEAGALGALARLAEADLTWFEEPVFPQSDHRALARVRAAAPMKIAAGENEFSVAGFERLIASGAVDIVQPEIAKFGGLTPARRVADVVAAAGLPMVPHNYSLGPSLLANVHWAMTTPGVPWLELPWLPPGQTFPAGWEPDLVDGALVAPTGPGWGVGSWSVRSWGSGPSA